tara:strand:- start:94 stop:732 length:639 start_codon:yes stop_codon:yes gene_type:complete
LKNNQYNKVLIIGKSEKFIKEIKKNYTFKKLDIIPWRQIHFYLGKKLIKYNLVFICGFDFSTYLKNRKTFERKNIFEIIYLLRKIANRQTMLIYINTQKTNNKNYTFSRYRYAKQKLAYLIFKKFKNCLIFNSDLIKVNEDVSINSNLFSKLIFYFFSKFNLIKTIDIKKLFSKIKNMLYLKDFPKQQNIKGLFITIPRTQLIDRFLRLILG